MKVKVSDLGRKIMDDTVILDPYARLMMEVVSICGEAEGEQLDRMCASLCDDIGGPENALTALRSLMSTGYAKDAKEMLIDIMNRKDH